MMSADNGQKSRPPGIFAYLLNELRQGWQDIRQKVVEEEWFGRVVTAAPVMEVERDIAPEHDQALPGRRPFEEQWAPREPGLDRDDDHDHHHQQQPDLGIDR